jgi:FtsP/CotA-like multicopper oxidase with cupredoxin domain
VTKPTMFIGLVSRSVLCAAMAASGLIAGAADAAVPGITGTVGTVTGTVSFNLAASPIQVQMPDGSLVYSWSYGCGQAPATRAPGAAAVASAPAAFLPTNWVTTPALGATPAVAASTTPSCGVGQLPGPTLIVTEGQTVTVNLYNGLPAVAGNTSIVFSGFATTASTNAVPGLVAPEAAPGATVSYTFTASKPGTYAYYSGSRAELQVEMGLYGALVVLPSAPVAPASCNAGNPTIRGLSGGTVGGTDYRLSTSAYDHPSTCYDREFLFQFAEMDGNIHQAVENCVSTTGCTQLNVVTDPYHPNYFLINGRSFPDDGDPNYTALYPTQPYNGNPQLHPGETMLLRVIGQGRSQHPFHIHANHGRILARDGNLIESSTDPTALAGPLYYTIPTVSGQAQDVLFTYTAKGLNWDIYGHNLNRNPPLPLGPTAAGNPSGDPSPCYPDVNGYYTAKSNPAAPVAAANYYEWCADHNRPIPITPPDPQIVANGLWYGGTPYLGLTSTPLGGGAPQFLSTPLPPGANIQNPTAGYAFMWHSHAERELTTNNVFPGGMLMMLVVQPPAVGIDETL